ncbi:EamA family transporter [Clostridium estertheticum]|uniref:EamA family transporter n=1 Tax=Clostridium estertheticum TaxID=238834 RepID=UPI001C0CB42E|nr:EamA family transporter [Clostridium estertheticum]MBU3177568.1 EamA family transporter [Clostridium estertheticum]
MYYTSIIITIVATATYMLSQKSINESMNPFVSLIVTYGVAIIASILGLILIPMDSNVTSSIKHLTWASFAVGISAFGLELGYLYVYRSGWNVSIAPILISVISTILLVILSIIIYKTRITFTNCLGILLSIIGLILINKK